MLFDEDDVTVVKALLAEIDAIKIKKTEEMIEYASRTSTSNETSFIAGGIDSLVWVETAIQEIIEGMKQKRNEE